MGSSISSTNLRVPPNARHGSHLPRNHSHPSFGYRINAGPPSDTTSVTDSTEDEAEGSFSPTNIPEDVEAQHHHHVPNADQAFRNIGLQTSIAIALHKLPEGFITYSTNHANPSLGFSIFLAVFVHNITEGFALALPLYLSLHSRAKAMLWASLLGGISQPLGAGIAALWFTLQVSN